MPRKIEEHSSNYDIESADISIGDKMSKRLDGLRPLSRDCCIYKVPKRLRGEKHKDDYIPKVVSIGPFHRRIKDMLYMEEHKQRYLKHFLRRTGVPLEDYVEKIKRLRGCYDGEASDVSSDVSSDVFVSIILVDAAFIIELLVRNFSQPSEDDNDWIFTKPWMLQNIAPDMILLENQLPFFILEDLFADVTSNWDNAEGLPSLVELSYKFFQKTVHLQGNEDNLKNIISSRLEVKHFVDLIRTLHLPSLKRSQTGEALEITLNTPGWSTSCSPKVICFCDRIRRFLPFKTSQTEGPLESTLNTPCAKKLHQAGVKFQVSSSKDLFAIEFNEGILIIPQVKIHDYTKLTLRNLLAFEQCHCKENENHVSDYLRIMDGFVNTPMDVDFLVDNRIIENTLGDNTKVSSLINKLCVGVSWNNENYYFADLSKKLNNYCGKPWNKSKAILEQKYFNTPWAIISVCAAVFLILLTITQTVFTIIPVIN